MSWRDSPRTVTWSDSIRRAATSGDAAASGDPLWHVSLPGTPQQPFEAGDRIVIANSTQVFALDPATGAVLWSVDHGSPGVTERYSEPGGYWWFAGNGDGSALTGLVVASEPYRD